MPQEGTAQLTNDPAGSVLLPLPPANMLIRRSLPCSASPPNSGSRSGGHGVKWQCWWTQEGLAGATHA